MGESSDSFYVIFYNHVIRAHSRCRIPRLSESGDSRYNLVILGGSHTTRIQNDQCPECRKNRKGVPWPSSDFSAFLHLWPTTGKDKQVIGDESRDRSTNLKKRLNSPLTWKQAVDVSMMATTGAKAGAMHTVMTNVVAQKIEEAGEEPLA